MEENTAKLDKRNAELAMAAQGFIDVRDPHDGSLLFRYDPGRQLVEIRKRGVVRLVDLARFHPVDHQRAG